MNVHEYQAKQLLKGFGVPVAQGSRRSRLMRPSRRLRAFQGQCTW